MYTAKLIYLQDLFQKVIDQASTHTLLLHSGLYKNGSLQENFIAIINLNLAYFLQYYAKNLPFKSYLLGCLRSLEILDLTNN